MMTNTNLTIQCGFDSPDVIAFAKWLQENYWGHLPTRVTLAHEWRHRYQHARWGRLFPVATRRLWRIEEDASSWAAGAVVKYALTAGNIHMFYADV